MINSETFIVKRDGKKEAFSLDKIKNESSMDSFYSFFTRKHCMNDVKTAGLLTCFCYDAFPVRHRTSGL